MVKRKRVRRTSVRSRSRSASKSKTSGGNRYSVRIWRSFYTFLFAVVISLAAFLIQTFLQSKLWIVTFIMIGLLAGVIALAFFLVWLILLFMSFLRKK